MVSVYKKNTVINTICIVKLHEKHVITDNIMIRSTLTLLRTNICTYDPC